MLEVKRLRQAREWNQTELAYHAGLAPSVISEIENGKREPSARTLRKLAEALKVDVADLFPKGQAALPLGEAPLELGVPLAAWLEEQTGHAYLAGTAEEIREFVQSGERAERLALLRDEREAFAEERRRRGLPARRALSIGGVTYTEIMVRYLSALFVNEPAEVAQDLSEAVDEIMAAAGA